MLHEKKNYLLIKFKAFSLKKTCIFYSKLAVCLKTSFWGNNAVHIMIKLLILLSIHARKTPLLYLEHINSTEDVTTRSIRLHQVILKIDIYIYIYIVIFFSCFL